MALFDGDQLKTSATKFAKGFTPGQKVVTGLLAAILLIAGVAYSKYAGRPQYAPLFTNLAASDAASITTKLASDKVPYQLADGGTAILVPQGQVYQERLNLAQADLPAGGSVGLELMDKEGITTSQAVQSADYQRALQGELEATIGAIQGVSAAQVTLALPAQSDFVIADQTKPQASVLVTMASGQQLSSGQVTGIVHLVASSIPNLDPADVTVVDSSGNVLAAPGVGITAGGTDVASTYENTLAAKINSQLVSIVGLDHSNVQVSADVDTSQKQTTSELLATDPKGKVISGVTSSSTSTEQYGAGSTAAPAGVLGTTATSTGSNTTTSTTGTLAGTGTATGTTGVNATNTGGTSSTSTTTGSNGYNKTSNDTTYDMGKQTIVTTQGPGTVNRLSIAVLVDTKSKANLASITKLASQAAGLNTKRGDTIQVVQLPFSTTAATTAATATKAAAKAKSGAAMTGLIRLVVSILGVLALVVLMLRSTKKEKREDISASLERFSDGGGGQLALPSGSAGALGGGAGGLAGIPALPSARTTAAAGELAGLIEDSPEEVAKVLRSWMHDRAGSR